MATWLQVATLPAGCVWPFKRHMKNWRLRVRRLPKSGRGCLGTSQLLWFRGVWLPVRAAGRRPRVSDGLLCPLGRSAAGGLVEVRHMVHHKLATQPRLHLSDMTGPKSRSP